MSEAFEAQARVTLRLWLKRAAKVVALVPLGILAIPINHSSVLMLPAMAIVVGLSLFTHFLGKVPALSTVRLDAAGLTLGDAVPLPLTSFRAELQADTRHLVHVLDARGTHTSAIDFDNAADAERFLTHLRGLGVPTQQATSLASKAGGTHRAAIVVLGALSALLLGYLGFHAGFMFAVFVFSAMALIVAAARPSVRIGTDGIRIDDLSTKRFVPFSEIVSTSLNGRDIVLRMRSGPDQTFACTSDASDTKYTFGRETPQERAKIFRDHLERARAAYEQNVTADGGAFAKGSEDGQTWKNRVTNEAIGYREAAPDNVQLRSVLDHAAAAPTARVAAAVKLAKEGGDEAKARIRIAAAETASPKLRIALEKAANGEVDAALDEAIEAERAT